MLKQPGMKSICIIFLTLIIGTTFFFGCATNRDVRLYNAIRYNKDQYALELIKSGCNIEVKANGNGWRPLLLATAKNKTDLVETLLIAGADPDVQLKNGMSALHIAAQHNQVDIISLLIDNQADFNLKTEQGSTPLYGAASRNKVASTKRLLEAGADVSIPIYNGWTALSQAAYKGYFQIVELCAKHGAKHSLHTYAATGDLSQVQSLVSSAKDANRGSVLGFTPLHFAARNSRLEVAKYLLKNGAEIDKTTDNGFTPLHSASETDSIEMIDFLLSQGADIEHKGDDGRTPLHVAARKGRLETTRCLLEKGAELDAQSNSGATPFYEAAFYGHEKIVRHLLNMDANVEKGYYPWTPLSAAADKGHLEIVQMLLSSNMIRIDHEQENGTTALYRAAIRGYADIVRSLLEAGADLNMGYKNWTPLHAAADNGHVMVAKLLLDHGADIDAVHLQTKQKPVDLAYRKKNVKMLGLLTGYRYKKATDQARLAINSGKKEEAVEILKDALSYYEDKIQKQDAQIKTHSTQLKKEKQKTAIASALNTSLQQIAMSTGNASLIGQTTANEISAKNRKYSETGAIHKARQIKGAFSNLKIKCENKLSCIQTNIIPDNCLDHD
jgi:ankyrin repeat protein